jgi:hypothetical protein
MVNAEISQEAISSKEKRNQEAPAAAGPLLVSDLDWSTEEARETRARLAALEADWDAPGMEAYDHL